MWRCFQLSSNRFSSFLFFSECQFRAVNYNHVITNWQTKFLIVNCQQNILWFPLLAVTDLLSRFGFYFVSTSNCFLSRKDEIYGNSYNHRRHVTSKEIAFYSFWMQYLRIWQLLYFNIMWRNMHVWQTTLIISNIH